ncbi:ceramide glucosyltransferase (plasmid) [Sphingomonas sp. MM-1]|uniref:CYTH and CHAD domain-containing protein n=1 Tax=Sphingomonas sp. MM-1 TaxID=745310 RepID=UPI0002C085A7|nr:CHAD domain-containing protein [Sphingomonas sp. MM-1]AGH51986.1 ceramide glucosyltransferase [Sphingomonas sp. MM-1]
MADEIELKLDLTPEAANALEAAALLPGNPDIAEQRSIYFDTPDHRLSKAGLSLRIRRSGKKRIQTVKADGASAAGLFMRSEWERPVDSDTPVLDDTTPIRALLGGATDTIAPAFEVWIERRTWIIGEGEATIELVLDRGEAVAGERSSPICEIELELKQGNPAALFALARRIDAVAPVRLGVQSKAERGYRLTGRAPTMVKAEPVTLGAGMTAAEAFRHIVQSCVRQFRLNEALLLLLSGREAGALHQARVALRRLRSAFSIFKPVIGGKDHLALRGELRWLASELADARNLDVLLERAGPGALHDRIAAAREAAYDRVGEVLASARVRALMPGLAEWTASGDWLDAPGAAGDRDQPARDFAVTALDRYRRKVKKGGRDLAHIDDEARHEVRKDAKKLRYASEFFTSLFERKRERRRYKRFVDALENLQDQLGALNDLAAAPQLVGQLGLADDPDAARLLAEGKCETLLEAAVDAHDDLIDMKRFWR